MDRDKVSHFDIEFIDPLFAVSIHLGLSHGLFEETWFQEWRLPLGSEAFGLAVFGLGFLTLLLAWVGYHESIKRRPVRALGRFAVDVLLVILYAVMLVKFRDFRATLLLLVAVYALYVVWDLLKSREYRGEYEKVLEWKIRYRREIVTFGWFCAFAGLWLLSIQGNVSNGILLVLAYVATIGHRINKEVAMWGALRAALGRLLIYGR